MTAEDFPELCSMLELCFGDVNDEEGLGELHDQLEVYPQRVEPFLRQLDLMIAENDGELGSMVLEAYAHISSTPQNSLEWFRWLRSELSSS